MIRRFFDRILNRKALAELTPAWKVGMPQYPEVSFDSMIRLGYRKNELIFACIDAKARTASQVSNRVVDDDGKVIDGHPYNDLIKNPNPDMTESDFWASVIIYQDTAGVAYYEKERNNGGDVIRLWPLRPDWVRPVPGRDTPIAYYEYRPDGETSPKQIAVEDVVALKIFDPLNMYNSYPPVAVASRVGDVDNAMTDFLNKFMQEGGIPPGIIKTKKKLRSENEAENISRRFSARYGGHRKWNKGPAVFDADADWQKAGFDFQEMGFEALDARNEARICMVLRVPPIIIAAKIGLDRSTYSNFETARRQWWEDVLIPIYKNHNDGIGSQLLVDFASDGESLRAAWNFSGVPALNENVNDRWKRANDAWNTGAITRNEFYRETGQEEKGPAGDVYKMPFASVEVPANQSKAMETKQVPGEDERVELEGEFSDAIGDYYTEMRKDVEKRIAERYG